jgi:hypothetical protein
MINCKNCKKTVIGIMSSKNTTKYICSCGKVVLKYKGKEDERDSKKRIL